MATAEDFLKPIESEITSDRQREDLVKIVEVLRTHDLASIFVRLINEFIGMAITKEAFPSVPVVDLGREHPGSVEFRKRWDDIRLADELIERLNALVTQTPNLGALLGILLQKLVVMSDPFGYIAHHPTIQVYGPGEDAPGDDFDVIPELSAGVTPLGLLNGIVGTIPDGKREGWGYIAAIREDDGRISGFERADLSTSTDKAKS